jgi:hypothetical protein
LVARAEISFNSGIAGRFVLDNLAFVAPPDVDFYRVDVVAGQSLQIATTTPAGGSGEFVNDLDPMIIVYDSEGNFIAQDDNSADGRNAFLDLPDLAGGTYYIEVVSVGTTLGEYTLAVSTDPGVAAAALIPGGGGAAPSLAGSLDGALSGSAARTALAPAPVAITALTSTTSIPASTSYLRKVQATSVDQAIAAVAVDPAILQGEQLHEALSWDRLLTSRRRSLTTKI